MEWHDPQIVVPAFAGWTGILFAALRWSLARNLKTLEDKVSENSAATAKALGALAEHKTNIDREIAGLRLEMNTKLVCGNHGRMENNDEKLFLRMDQLHGDVRELVGGVKALANSLDLVNEHLLNGGK